VKESGNVVHYVRRRSELPELGDLFQITPRDDVDSRTRVEEPGFTASRVGDRLLVAHSLDRSRHREDPIVATFLDRRLDLGRIAFVSEATLANTQVVAAETAVTAAFLSLSLLVFRPLDSWATTTASGVLGA